MQELKKIKTDRKGLKAGSNRLQNIQRFKSAAAMPKKGFTILEVILAIAITGFLLAGATSFVVSVSNIWLEREERHFFEDHVDGVSEFLKASLSSAGQEIALESSDTPKSTQEPNPDEITPVADAPNNERGTQATDKSGSLLTVSEQPVDWAKPPGYASYQDPLIHFRLSSAPPLLVNEENAPAVGIDLYLYFEQDEGLSLLWLSSIQEESEDIDDLRRTQISSLVTAVQYVYWDDRFEKWEIEDTPREDENTDEFALPRFIKLTFEYEGENKERFITIPVPSIHAILF